MRIFVEGYAYQDLSVGGVLEGLKLIEKAEGAVTLDCVGYFWDASARDCVFVLPKVVLKKGEVFGMYSPKDLLHLGDAHSGPGRQEREALYRFAVWIYQAISLYHRRHPQSPSILRHKRIVELGGGNRYADYTFFELMLALVQFARENRDLVFFALRNIRSGLERINWSRTISTTPATIQGDEVAYLHPINKKRQINFDEELLVIFFSILRHIGERYGFPVEINLHFDLIEGRQFELYIKGRGKARLRQIRHRYFSDKALQLWDLCYAFFDAEHQLSTKGEASTEYLLVKSFNHVFEDMIDVLIGEEKDRLPSGLKAQKDGGRLDHIYRDRSLVGDGEIYFIGDSKYYGEGKEVDSTSLYKQYTYAKNAVQWGIDGLNKSEGERTGDLPRYRDELTEGYNPTPSFFVRAYVPEDLSYAESRLERMGEELSYHFEGRLFDRDTLWVLTYRVNLLYVLSAYVRSRGAYGGGFLRGQFREDIVEVLNKEYEFYYYTLEDREAREAFVGEHFRDLAGKMYCTQAGRLILAFEKEDKDRPKMGDDWRGFELE